MELTLEGRAELIREAYRLTATEKLPPGLEATGWDINVFPDAILVRGTGSDPRLYRIPYTMTADTLDSVTFGEPTPVEMQLVPATEAQVELREPTGDRWAVRIIKTGYSRAEKPIPGTDKRGRWYYTEEAVESAATVFNGAPVYAFEFDGSRFSHLWGLSIEEKVRKGMVGNLFGYLEQAREADGEALAELVTLHDTTTEAVRQKLLELHRTGRADLVGLSVHAPVRGVVVESQEGMVFAVLGFDRPGTVDVATHPAAGGAFLQALESLPEEEVTMVKELLAKLRARRPDLAAKLGNTPTEAEVQEALLSALEPPEAAPSQVTESQEVLRHELDESKRLRCSLTLDKRLDAAKLPAPVAAKIRKRYDGSIFEVAALEADILEEKNVLDALAQEGHVQGLGASRAQIVIEARDKLQLGMDRLFRAVAQESAAAAADVPAFKSLSHAFSVITGRALTDMLNHRIATAEEAITAASWPNILGASMHRRIIKDFLEPAFGDDKIISRRPGGVSNFKQQETLRVKYFPDLDDVDPETDDYRFIADPGDEKVYWSVIQKGNILAVTRKTLLNDDLGAVTKLIGRLGRSARRTRAKFVWGFWINNAVYDVDTTAWFHNDHGNLGSTALTATKVGADAVMAAITALAKMTEPGSGEKLGLPDLKNLKLHMVVPIDLMAIAHQLNISPQVLDGANLVANPVYQMFGPSDERIIVCPLLTDATDWGVFRDPADVESIEIGYLNDQSEPEFWVASVPTIGQMFVADKQEFKVRYELGGDVVDFRGAYKHVVAN